MKGEREWEKDTRAAKRSTKSRFSSAAKGGKIYAVNYGRNGCCWLNWEIISMCCQNLPQNAIYCYSNNHPGAFEMENMATLSDDDVGDNFPRITLFSLPSLRHKPSLIISSRIFADVIPNRRPIILFSHIVQFNFFFSPFVVFSLRGLIFLSWKDLRYTPGGGSVLCVGNRRRRFLNENW